MADFLTRLAERTLGSASVVQPLITPTFAPGPGIEGDYAPSPAWPEASPDDLGGTQATFARAQLPPSSHPVPVSPPLGLPDDPSSVTPGSPPRTSADSRLTPGSARRSHAADRVETPSRRVTTQDDNQHSLTSASLLVPAADASPRPRSTESAPGRSGPITVQTRAAHEQNTNPQPAQPLDALQSLSGLQQDSDPTRQGRRDVLSAQPATSFRRRKSTPVEVRSASVAQPKLADPPSTPLTIRVTIGRVDVRAIMPPAPPAPRAKPAQSGPTLSLDAYLKQRNEGKR